MCYRVPVDIEEAEVHAGAVNAAELMQLGRGGVVNGLPIINTGGHFVRMMAAGCKSKQQAGA